MITLPNDYTTNDKQSHQHHMIMPPILNDNVTNTSNVAYLLINTNWPGNLNYEHTGTLNIKQNGWKYQD